MPEIDDLVRRTVDAVTRLATGAARFAGKVLLVSIVVCGGSFALGVAALSGGIETVWIVLGIVFGAIAIGGAAVAWWRANSVRRHVPDIADEVRALATERGDQAVTVIETFEVGDPDPDAGSAIVMTRQMGGGFRSLGPELADTKHLNAAATAMTTFPFQMLVTALVTGVFAFLGAIFLLALAIG